VTNYLRRAVDAVLSLFSKTVFWPDEQEHLEISQRLRQKHHFPKCVGAIDGTHLGLAFKPEKDGEEYWTRKQHYAVAATLVCDDCKELGTSMLVGRVQFMTRECIRIQHYTTIRVLFFRLGVSTW
jgi:hypothetical protein